MASNCPKRPRFFYWCDGGNSRQGTRRVWYSDAPVVRDTGHGREAAWPVLAPACRSRTRSRGLWCQLRNCQKNSKSRDKVGRRPLGLLKDRFCSLRGQESLDFGAGGRAGRAADPTAFDAGDCGAEAERLIGVPSLGQPQHKATVQRITGPKRIHRTNLEDRYRAQHAALQNDDIAGPIADREESVTVARDPL